MDSTPYSLVDFVTDAKSRITEVDINTAEKWLTQGYLLLDVREPNEYSAVKIKNSLNVPRGILEASADLAFPDAIPALRDNRDKPWLVLCATGGRSALAVDTLQKMGFTNVTNMLGGITAWIAANKETTT